MRTFLPKAWLVNIEIRENPVEFDANRTQVPTEKSLPHFQPAKNMKPPTVAAIVPNRAFETVLVVH